MQTLEEVTDSILSSHFYSLEQLLLIFFFPNKDFLRFLDGPWTALPATSYVSFSRYIQFQHPFLKSLREEHQLIFLITF